MQFFDLLKKRRSVRKYKATAIEPEKIDTILKAALMSPSSKRSCCWEFMTIENESKLIELSKCKTHGAEPIAKAKLAIIVMGNQTISDIWVEDCAIASLLIQLQAEELGIGSCWIQVRERMHSVEITSEQFIKNTLSIPDELRVLSIVAIGYPDETKNAFNEEKFQFNKIHREIF